MRVTNISEPTLNASALRYPSVFIACGFGSGFIRPAPGTWGTVVGLIIWWFLLREEPWVVQLVAIVGTTLLGQQCTDRVIKRFHVQDPGCVVIDEMVGVWIALLAAPISWQAMLIGFALFRFFDIVKPWPVSWADQNIKSAWGVMLDDIIAGLLALVVLQVSLWTLPGLARLLA